MTNDEREYLQRMISKKVGDINIYQDVVFVKACEINKVNTVEVLSKSRVKNIIKCKTMFFAFCRKVLYITYKDIGEKNDYCHTTVLNLVKQHDNYISYDMNYIKQYQKLIDWHKQYLKDYDKDRD